MFGSLTLSTAALHAVYGVPTRIGRQANPPRAQCPPFGQLNSSFFGGPEDFSESGDFVRGTSLGQAPGAGSTPVVSTPSATTA
jgi:hypothetical protein